MTPSLAALIERDTPADYFERIMIGSMNIIAAQRGAPLIQWKPPGLRAHAAKETP